MSNIKKYKVKEDWKDYEVTIEVNHELLTPELATQINEFWSDSEDRLDAEDGDPVKAVIRLAGSCLINEMLREGSMSFSKENEGMVKRWTEWLASQEGWPPADMLGIRCIDAEVLGPSFDDLELTEIAN